MMNRFLYRDIATSLRERISRGELMQGRLPSERDLTGEFGVQRATIRRALKALEQEGLVFRDATRGTFAAPRPGDEFPAAAAGRTNIALVIGQANDTTAPGDIASGLTRAFAGERQSSVVWMEAPTATGHAEVPAPAPQTLLDREIGGAVLWPHIPADTGTLRALRAAMPLVLLDRRVPGFESDFVGIDDYAAAYAMTGHLIQNGHRRIGFLAVASLAGTVQTRARGWAAALADAGIESCPDGALLRTGSDLDLYADADALSLFLQGGGGHPLTAVVCSNDTVAAALICFLRSAGRRVPEDVAVTGFGNAFPLLLDALGLTTVAQPWERIGFAAGEILRERRSNPLTVSGDYREVYLPVSLVVRGSCGAAAVPSY